MSKETSGFKKIYNITGNTFLFILLAIVVYGFALNLGINPFLFIFLFVVPFPITYYLSVTKRKNVYLMLILTLVFSWIVTLILAFIPAEKKI